MMTEQFAIAGISIAALLLGLVEFAKKFRAFQDQPERIQLLAFGLGVVLTGIAYALDQGLIPPDVAPYVVLVVVALSGGPAAMGYYDLARRFVSDARD